MFRTDNRFYLEESRDGFGTRSHGIVERLGLNRTKVYPLPQSTARQYMRLRPKDLRFNPLKPDQYERMEVIGPHQMDGDKIWFGNDYYDGEGMSGVGAFGYFDTSTRKYTLFSPLEVAPCEVSALLVETDTIWVALDHFGEDISRSPGGFVRWNRKTHEVRYFPAEFLITGMRIDGRSLRLETHDGYAFLLGGKLRRFLSNGREIEKFTPPPSHN